MGETLQRRWIAKLHFRQSARREATASEFPTILIFSLSGLALSLLAIGYGWLGHPESWASLFLLLQ
jgi:hypothetical protein